MITKAFQFFTLLGLCAFASPHTQSAGQMPAFEKFVSGRIDFYHHIQAARAAKEEPGWSIPAFEKKMSAASPQGRLKVLKGLYKDAFLTAKSYEKGDAHDPPKVANAKLLMAYAYERAFFGVAPFGLVKYVGAEYLAYLSRMPASEVSSQQAFLLCNLFASNDPLKARRIAKLEVQRHPRDWVWRTMYANCLDSSRGTFYIPDGHGKLKLVQKEIPPKQDLASREYVEAEKLDPTNPIIHFVLWEETRAKGHSATVEAELAAFKRYAIPASDFKYEYGWMTYLLRHP